MLFATAFLLRHCLKPSCIGLFVIQVNLPTIAIRCDMDCYHCAFPRVHRSRHAANDIVPLAGKSKRVTEKLKGMGSELIAQSG